MAPLNDDRLSPWLEEAWLQRYLERALTEEEREWFEAYALDKPSLVAALLADADLRDALHASTQGAAPLAATARAASTPERARWRRGLAMAACLLLGVVAGAGLRPPSSTPALDVVEAPPRVSLDLWRGDSGPGLVRDGRALASDYVLLDVQLPIDTVPPVVLRQVGQPDKTLTLSNDAVVSLLVPRRAAAGAAPMTLLVRTRDREFHKDIPLKFLQDGAAP